MPRSLPGPVTGLLLTVTSPDVVSSKPATMRSKVDLPHPEAPIRQTNSPSRMVTSMRARASISSSPTVKRLVTPRTASWARLATSGMVLRAPAQHAVGDHDNDPVGDEPHGTDHDHAG